ncbi:hypothetical protein [Marinifilum caeruleilacunae]|uniref:DUF4367 domain-containing protein n=1 Tax=Marinifilum caeruleilacunae TaxID=2499076 RepID=A0ABX1WRZ3_9BACT|nr:hypothetical protein [Marinifilum caeruleilacunae]NOU58699.1 hypothetical protein [Marinifilum caeruleilacunae]
MNFKVLTACVVLLSTHIALSAQVNHKRFLVKSGHLEMKVEGISEGIRTIWFDNYGRQYRDELKVVTTTEIFGMKSVEETHTLSIVNGEEFYSVDLLSGTGTKHTYGVPAEFYQAYDQMSEEQKNQFADEIFSDLGGTKLGTTNMLGRKCDLIKVLGVTETIYKGVVLKTKVNLLGKKNTETATLFKENISVPASKFSPPQNIDWTDLNSAEGQFSDLDGEYYNDSYDDEDDSEAIPVSYPFESFKKATQNIEFNGYKKAMAMSMDGQHITTYMKSMNENFMIVASSIENIQSQDYGDELARYQHFKHNGNDMYLGNATGGDEEDFDGVALIIKYPSKDMVVSIVSSNAFGKSELLKIADQLKF